MSESSKCTRCGAAFTCGVEAGQERCWCADYAALKPEPDAAGCLCPACLSDLAQQQGKCDAGAG